jgi:hypothetical protein
LNWAEPIPTLQRAIVGAMNSVGFRYKRAMLFASSWRLTCYERKTHSRHQILSENLTEAMFHGPHRFNSNQLQHVLGKYITLTNASKRQSENDLCSLGGMKIGKLSIASWFCGLFLVAFSTPRALADADYTYVFTANPGQVTCYNGTSFTINVINVPPSDFPPNGLWYTLQNIHILAEIDMGAWAGYPPYEGPAPASSTPVSYSPSRMPVYDTGHFEVSYANSSGWQGLFWDYWGGYTPFGCPTLDYVISSDEIWLNIDTGGSGQPFITPHASGTWALDVPDAGSSLELLAMATVALGAGRLLLRRRRN